MKRKLILTFLLLILLPMLVISVSMVTESRRMAVNNVNLAMEQTLEQACQEISNMADTIAFASDILFQDPVLRHYVGDVAEEDLQVMLDDVASLRDSMGNSEASLKLHRVRLYVNDAKMAAREHVHFFSVSEAAEQDWYEAVVQDSGLGSWSGVYYDASMADTAGCWLVSYRRIVRSNNKLFANDGVLSMDVNVSELYSRFGSIPSRDTEIVFLLDTQGKVLSAQDRTLFGTAILPETVLEQVYAGKSGIVEAKLDAGDRILVFSTVPVTGWKLVSCISPDHVLDNYTFWDDIKLVVCMLLIIVFFVGASYVVIHVFNKELARRITAVARRMENSTQRPQPDNRKESDLDKAERLALEIIENNQRLTEENYRVHLQERKAQLLALQAQINPHFLYNTLECINWMAFRHGAEDISQAVTALARYFRLTLSEGKNVVSIADEIELAKTYLAIQNIRFESKIQTQIEAPEELKEYAIPKLILQPFVENAVIHGILKKPQRAGKITIVAQIEQEDIHILVSDDGIGIPDRLLEEITQSVDRKDHYGIYNVRERIHLYYGEGYGVVISSREEAGTTVRITVGKRKLSELEG